MVTMDLPSFEVPSLNAPYGSADSIVALAAMLCCDVVFACLLEFCILIGIYIALAACCGVGNPDEVGSCFRCRMRWCLRVSGRFGCRWRDATREHAAHLLPLPHALLSACLGSRWLIALAPATHENAAHPTFPVTPPHQDSWWVQVYIDYPVVWHAVMLSIAVFTATLIACAEVRPVAKALALTLDLGRSGVVYVSLASGL